MTDHDKVLELEHFGCIMDARQDLNFAESSVT